MSKTINEALKDLITEKPDYELPKAQEIDISDSEENRKKQKFASYMRELAQIRTAIKRKQKVYYYDLAHAEFIIQALQEHPELKDQIEFVLE